MAPPFRKMVPRVERFGTDQQTWEAFMNGAYQAQGCCHNPACRTPTAVGMTSGMSPSTRVCYSCFEFFFECSFPTRRGIETIRERVNVANA